MRFGISNILFLFCLVAGVACFLFHVRKLIRNIRLGRPIDCADRKAERWKILFRIALGQGKMTRRPVAGTLHILVYIGFLVINIELLEIVIDGLFGTHRALSQVLGLTYYGLFTATLEVFAFLGIVAVTVFFIRRNFRRIDRFEKPEMKTWPRTDANQILIFEFLLMSVFLTMNAADGLLQTRGIENYVAVKSRFPISDLFIRPYLQGLSEDVLRLIERAAWWLHFIGVLLFLNYLYYSKHLHILLAFPNTYFADLAPKGKLNLLESVRKEVALMMDPQAVVAPEVQEGVLPRLGASDIWDLDQRQLLGAYACTECGRCTDQCPANMTGKKLSPRKIVMDVRDRIEEVGRNIDAHQGRFKDDGKQLIHDNYISPEELWACTACNACVEACPILINPLSIILDLRRYLVMEKSAAPHELNVMMSQIENNGAPWPFSPTDRLNWKDEI